VYVYCSFTNCGSDVLTWTHHCLVVTRHGFIAKSQFLNALNQRCCIAFCLPTLLAVPSSNHSQFEFDSCCFWQNSQSLGLCSRFGCHNKIPLEWLSQDTYRLTVTTTFAFLCWRKINNLVKQSANHFRLRLHKAFFSKLPNTITASESRTEH